MPRYYDQNASRWSFLPLESKLAVASAAGMAASLALDRLSVLPFYISAPLAVASATAGGFAAMLAFFTPPSQRIARKVRRALFSPEYGNPLHLRDGELLPKVSCQEVGDGSFVLTISANQSVSVDSIIAAAPEISSALTGRFKRLAVSRVLSDEAYNEVRFEIEDATADHALTVGDPAALATGEVTKLRVDKRTSIDLSAAGSILIAGKTRSGKTTGAISLLLQVLAGGRDEHGSTVVIIDPKQAELSRLPHSVSLDKDGAARGILDKMSEFQSGIVARQQYLNQLSAETGDAVKWWQVGMKPSVLFIDEYVALRSLLPKKPSKDDDYCLETFDNLLKRIVTTGASAGCFVILSLAEASVAEGGLPAMLRSAFGMKILFRPTLPEARLLWDSEKLEGLATNRSFSAGDAWLSSTDGAHDLPMFVHFPRLDFPEYAALARLLREYYGDDEKK